MEQPAMNPGWRKSSYSNGAGSNCVEVGTWRTSSHSNNGGDTCVEVGAAITGPETGVPSSSASAPSRRPHEVAVR